MTDPAQNPSSDPLKALEDALKGSGAPAAEPAASVVPTAPVAEGVTPATAPPEEQPAPAEDEQAKQRAEIEALTAQHDAEDQQQLQTQLETLNQLRQQTSDTQPSVVDTPSPTTDQTSDDDGFAIRQITHQKL